MLPLLAAGLTAGASLLSGLFGRSDDKKARAEAARVEAANRAAVEAGNEVNRQLGERYLAQPMVNLSGLVSDAEAAGFNPLTIVRAGGLSAYSKSNDQFGYQMMSPQVFQASPLPQVRSVGSVAAGALSAGVGSWIHQTNIVEQQDFQKSLMAMTLAKKASSVPGVKGSSVSTAKKADKVPTGLPTQAETGKKEVTNPFTRLKVDKSSADSATWTQRYGEGELAETIFFLKTAGDDFIYNVTGMTAQDRYNWTAKMLGLSQSSGPLVVNVNKAR